MKTILQSKHALNCLDSKVKGKDLFMAMEFFASFHHNELYRLDYDIIITILRAALPLGLSLYKVTNKPIGFISAKRHKDLSIEITYKNIPEFENPLIVDSWLASGSTVKEVCKHLSIKDINLFGLVASKQAMKLIKPKNYVIGYLVDAVDENNYLIPPEPFKPRDGGDDLFINIKHEKKKFERNRHRNSK